MLVPAFFKNYYINGAYTAQQNYDVKLKIAEYELCVMYVVCGLSEHPNDSCILECKSPRM